MRHRGKWRGSVAITLAAAVAVAYLATTTTATARPAAKPKIITFVFGPRGFNDVTKAWFNGFDKAKRQLPNVDIEEKGTSKLELDPAKYLDFINTALVEKPDGIVVVPNVGSSMAAGLDRIAKQGTKVLIMDQDVLTMKNKVAFVGTDNTSAGRAAAKWLVAQYKANNLKSNEVGALRSSPGITSTDQRLAGFKDGLKGSPLKLVAIVGPGNTTGGFDAAKARSAMSDMLTAHPNLGGVFSVQDSIGLGAATALVSQKRLNVKHVSIDASASAITVMQKQQGIDADVAQHFLTAGYLSVKTLARALNGHTVPRNVDTGITVVTRANAAAYLKTAKAESK
jgi:ribose transport system substrate-binding protein